jgi:DNA-binding NarL/FixJ family response regulator
MNGVTMLESQIRGATELVRFESQFGLPSNNNHITRKVPVTLVSKVDPVSVANPVSTVNPARGPEPLMLTNAERVIAHLVAQGARNHDIARQLGVSHRTVESHLSNIFIKLGIGSRVQLALLVSNSPKAEV